MNTFPTIKIKPAKPTSNVINPTTAKPIAFGVVTEVPREPFWLRRIKEGSVIVVSDPVADAMRKKDESETFEEHEKGALKMRESVGKGK